MGTGVTSTLSLSHILQSGMKTYIRVIELGIKSAGGFPDLACDVAADIKLIKPSITFLGHT